MNIKECPGKFAGGPMLVTEQEGRQLVAGEEVPITISADVDQIPTRGQQFVWLTPGAVRTGLMKVVAVRHADDGDPLGRIVSVRNEPLGVPPEEEVRCRRR